MINHNALLATEQWQRVREYVYRRDHGRCFICGSPGRDAHHWSYDWGFFDPDLISLLCRPCHLIWQGRNPDHLPDDHPMKADLLRIAYLSRCLGRGRRFETPVVDLFGD